MDVEVVEVVPGEYDVTPAGGATVRVLVPAGVGVPGVPEEDLAGGLVVELVARGEEPAGTMDVAQVIRGDPALLEAAAARAEEL